MKHWLASVTIVLIASAAIGAEDDELEMVQSLSIPDLFQTWNVAAAQDGPFVYATASMAGAITIFKRDSTSGQLSLLDTIKEPEVSGPVRLNLSPDGKYAAVCDQGLSLATIFKRDPASGKLVKLVSTPDRLSGIVETLFSPDNRYFYTASTAGLSVFRLEGEALSLIETQSGDGRFKGMRPFVASPDAHWIYTVAEQSATVGVFRRDEATGKVEAIQFIKNGDDGIENLAGAFRLDVSSDGKNLYVSSGRNMGDQAVSVFAIQADGQLKLLQQFINGKDDFEEFEGGNELKVSPDGKWVYVVASESDRLFRFARDASTGKLTFLSSQQAGIFTEKGAASLTFSPDCKFIYIADQAENAIEVYKVH